MAIKYTGDAGEPDLVLGIANKRASDSKYDRVTVCVRGVDDADSDPKTNSSEISGEQSITPVATLTKAIIDTAIADFRAAAHGEYASVDAAIAADIAFKQGADTLEEFIYNNLT